MNEGFFLITGASRGIGEALARTLLEQGNTVLGVCRTRSQALNFAKYYHLAFDLRNTSRLSEVIDEARAVVDNHAFDFLCLVNNASATEPIGPIEKCEASEIDAHVRIGLIAPMILTSLFIRALSDRDVRKKVAFVSADPAYFGSPDTSVYESCKAAINIFAQCVGLEQKDKPCGFEVVSIGPGMVDTSMQQAARSKSSTEFAGASFFQQAYLEGELQAPAKVAEKICTILRERVEPGKFVRVSEV